MLVNIASEEHIERWCREDGNTACMSHLFHYFSSLRLIFLFLLVLNTGLLRLKCVHSVE